MNCRYCGSPLSDNARFCRNCGKPVQAAAAPMSRPVERRPVQATAPRPEHKPERRPAVKPVPTNKKWKSLYTVLIVAGVIVIAFVIWILAGGGFGKKADVIDTMPPSSDTSVDSEEIDEPADDGVSDDYVVIVPSDKTDVDSETQPENPSDSNTEDLPNVDEETPDLPSPDADVDVENLVAAHREKYNSIVSALNAGTLKKITLNDGVTAYVDGGELKAIYAKQGTFGDMYRRYYYYDYQDYLFFAYYEGDNAHRFYLVGDKLIRWRFSPDSSDPQNAFNHDKENDNIFYMWEENVVYESNYLKDMYMDAINPNDYAMTDITFKGASSVLNENNIIYRPDNAFDSDLTTAWVEGAPGHGLKEELAVAFGKRYKISGMTIFAGYQKNEDIYYKNARPKDVTIMFDDFTTESFTLEDYFGAQHVEFAAPKDTTSVTIRIDSVYPGGKYEDTAISDIYYETIVD